MAPSEKLRLVFTPGCTELECLRKAAAAEATNYLVFMSMDSERRVSLLLNEPPRAQAAAASARRLRLRRATALQRSSAPP